MPTRARSFFLVHEPDHVRTVLADQTGRYSKETQSYADLRPLLGRGILTAEGDAWRAQRRLVTPCLNAARTHTLLDATLALTRELSGRWESRAALGERVDLRRDMVWLTLGILARSVFDADARASADEVSRAFDCVLGEIEEAGPGPRDPRERGAGPGPRDKALARLETEVRRVTQGKPGERARPWDLGAALRAARAGRCPFQRDGDPEPSERDVLLTMILAGHETTAQTLTFALGLLAEHPEAAEHVRSEAAQELSREAPLRERVARLSFTRSVVHETLRLYPSVWLVERRAERPSELAGYDVPAGTTLALCIYLAQRDASVWPDPARFVPERFLDDGARRKLLAFGVGPRGCAGAGFAVDEMTLALAELCRDFRLSVETKVVARAGVTLRTRAPLLARVTSAGEP